MAYTHSITVSLEWEEAVARTKEALGRQGFGVLTEIDMRANLAAEISPESANRIGDYLILGAFNPHLANRGLLTEPKIGALLPYNVVVRRAVDATETTIETIDAQVLARVSGNPAIREVASDADTRLKAALDHLRDA
ncbi:DUF302 domain-containing protein [Paeniglutamicibacter psychrophenolicus]|uniref:DUF302 domain-containing protein n=1 Tax=Paeniglutamicibacter psychrophenolicus TaxID=257454 RepID=UPI00278ADE98|nr:DUF302 domain-containing protein [Paeniglutamicibacter psychrophenolicus]MDQ0095151.1 uncharacterized protein (DUF302 family) [Paeniglutamicibacter psychrophenolicus]